MGDVQRWEVLDSGWREAFTMFDKQLRVFTVTVKLKEVPTAQIVDEVRVAMTADAPGQHVHAWPGTVRRPRVQHFVTVACSQSSFGAEQCQTPAAGGKIPKSGTKESRDAGSRHKGKDPIRGRPAREHEGTVGDRPTRTVRRRPGGGPDG